MDRTEAFRIVLRELNKCRLYNGIYDAKNGNEDYMHGILSVLEYIGYEISDEVGDYVSDKFIKNMIWSQEKAGE